MASGRDAFLNNAVFLEQFGRFLEDYMVVGIEMRLHPADEVDDLFLDHLVGIVNLSTVFEATLNIGEIGHQIVRTKAAVKAVVDLLPSFG